MSHDQIGRMSRRDFIGAAAAVSAGLVAGIPAVSAGESTRGPALSRGAKDGPITLYYEFRVAPPVNPLVLDEIGKQAGLLSGEPAFLGLSLKQMVGESTMVRNFPVSYKGLLGTAYADGVSATPPTLPFFYSLFIRFDGMGGLSRSGAAAWFRETIEPLLFVYRPDVGKTEIPFDYFTGLFLTVAAGDRDGVYQDRRQIIEFLRRQQDEPDNAYTTVNNHVSIHDKDLTEFEGKVLPLLKVAQDTYQPTDVDGGLPGTQTNTYYTRAVTTEILRNAYADGHLRSYMMHGVWESIWDHENSHLDPRFKLASTPVGAHVVAGPIEPFYQTRILVNN